MVHTCIRREHKDLLAASGLECIGKRRMTCTKKRPLFSCTPVCWSPSPFVQSNKPAQSRVRSLYAFRPANPPPAIAHLSRGAAAAAEPAGGGCQRNPGEAFLHRCMQPAYAQRLGGPGGVLCRPRDGCTLRISPSGGAASQEAAARPSLCRCPAAFLSGSPAPVRCLRCHTAARLLPPSARLLSEARDGALDTPCCEAAAAALGCPDGVKDPPALALFLARVPHRSSPGAAPRPGASPGFAPATTEPMGSTEELLLPAPKCVLEREREPAPSLLALGGRAAARQRRQQQQHPEDEQQVSGRSSPGGRQARQRRRGGAKAITTAHLPRHRWQPRQCAHPAGRTRPRRGFLAHLSCPSFGGAVICGGGLASKGPFSQPRETRGKAGAMATKRRRSSGRGSSLSPRFGWQGRGQGARTSPLRCLMCKPGPRVNLLPSCLWETNSMEIGLPDRAEVATPFSCKLLYLGCKTNDFIGYSIYEGY